MGILGVFQVGCDIGRISRDAVIDLDGIPVLKLRVIRRHGNTEEGMAGNDHYFGMQTNMLDG